MTPAHVLVVEDDLQTLDMFLFMLRDWGYTADGVLTGEDALARMAVRCPDVVLSDLVMAGMSGLDLLRAIRAMPDCHVCFFLVTGRCSVCDAVQAIDEGADECVFKPIDPDALHAMLEGRGFVGATQEGVV
jgi:CheY-like chemotaxis protein